MPFRALSKGEQDRCKLAFVLALNEIYDSKWLILDECLSTLHREKSAEVLGSLKELSDGRMVVVVDHQTVEGQFDRIVDLESGDV